MTRNKIVVGVDLSAQAGNALARAAEIARSTGAQLHVLHVVAASLLKEAAGNDEAEALSLRELVKKEAEQALREMVGAHDIPAEVELTFGDPTQEVLRCARVAAADLLVLGASSVPHHGMGALATRVVQHAPARVLMIREDDSTPRRVVAAIDFSSMSATVAKAAAEAAAWFRIPLVLVHVDRGIGFELYPRSTEDIRARDEQRQASLHAKLARLATTADIEPAACRIIPSPSVSSSLTAGDDADSTLLVVGTEGETSARYLCIGSETHRVLRRMPCSVMTVKPDQFTPAWEA